MGTVVLAIVFVGAALVFALYAVSARASSRSSLVRAQEDQAEMGVLIDDWTKLVQAEAQMPGGLGRSGEFKISKMEDLATQVGMTKPNTPRSQEDKTRPGVLINRYFYTEVRNAALGPMLEWVRRATAEISGLEIEGITLHPEPVGWRMDVTFRRWERVGT